MQGRQRFPRGLEQPREGYRFSADALLLACYPQQEDLGRVLDLGTGCGVVGLGLLLRADCGGSKTSVLGVERDRTLARAAEDNAQELGLQERFRVAELDVQNHRRADALLPESFDLAVANPPYRSPGSGRGCRSEEETRARFEAEGGLDAFVRAGAYSLKNRRKLVIIYGAERLVHLFQVLAQHRLEPKRMRLVHGARGRSARMALVEARKNGRPGLDIEPPLALYTTQGGRSVLTDEALRFCPFLR
jgi:tRNA1(Val) A37 N6-methylase TrmN6